MATRKAVAKAKSSTPDIDRSAEIAALYSVLQLMVDVCHEKGLREALGMCAAVAKHKYSPIKKRIPQGMYKNLSISGDLRRLWFARDVATLCEKMMREREQHRTMVKNAKPAPKSKT